LASECVDAGLRLGSAAGEHWNQVGDTGEGTKIVLGAENLRFSASPLPQSWAMPWEDRCECCYLICFAASNLPGGGAETEPQNQMYTYPPDVQGAGDPLPPLDAKEE